MPLGHSARNSRLVYVEAEANKEMDEPELSLRQTTPASL
jgi:hypothetical protein